MQHWIVRYKIGTQETAQDVEAADLAEATAKGEQIAKQKHAVLVLVEHHANSSE